MPDEAAPGVWAWGLASRAGSRKAGQGDSWDSGESWGLSRSSTHHDLRRRWSNEGQREHHPRMK